MIKIGFKYPQRISDDETIRRISSYTITEEGKKHETIMGNADYDGMLIDISGPISDKVVDFLTGPAAMILYEEAYVETMAHVLGEDTKDNARAIYRIIRGSDDGFDALFAYSCDMLREMLSRPGADRDAFISLLLPGGHGDDRQQAAR